MKSAPGDPFYTGAPWRRFRKWFLGIHKLCADPQRVHAILGIPVRATVVHHLVDRHVRPDLTFDSSNCQALCERCHNRITRDRQRA